MLNLYAKAQVIDPINTGDKIYARTTLQCANLAEGYKIVWCSL